MPRFPKDFPGYRRFAGVEVALWQSHENPACR
jgi:hypothetical protein